MAIQTIKTGAAVNDGTGDDARTCFTKINQNFTDNANAASRLVGTNGGNVMEVGAFGLGLGNASNVWTNDLSTFANLKANIGPGSRFFRCDAENPYAYLYSPSLFVRTVDTNFILSVHYAGKGVKAVSWDDASSSAVIQNLYSDKSVVIYNTTTASSPNVFVTSTGELQRSTSSERYKDIIGDLTLDDVAYKNAMTLHPIVYRSTASADNPNWHYYSFSAEKLGAYDPAFTLWRNTEEVTDENGVTQTVLLDEPVAEGINLNALVAFLHATNIKQHKLIEKLSKRVEVLENAKQ